jgi:hypothetical protein
MASNDDGTAIICHSCVIAAEANIIAARNKSLATVELSDEAIAKAYTVAMFLVDWGWAMRNAHMTTCVCGASKLPRTRCNQCARFV